MSDAPIGQADIDHGTIDEYQFMNWFPLPHAPHEIDQSLDGWMIGTAADLVQGQLHRTGCQLRLCQRDVDFTNRQRHAAIKPGRLGQQWYRMPQPDIDEFFRQLHSVEHLSWIRWSAGRSAHPPETPGN